ncbi:MAG: hypothetical protein ABJL54_05510, partial [Halioglobus sp.]
MSIGNRLFKINLNVAVASVLYIVIAGNAVAGKDSTEVGAHASEWDSNTTPGDGIFPVGGSGQLNGEFVIVERDGIQMGLRATDRKDGLLDPVSRSGSKTGVYIACTGEDQGETSRAEWNYDLHLDLRDTDTTLADYRFTLTQTFADSLYGSTEALDLSFPEWMGGMLNTATLYQQSWNPNFGTETFDQFA